MSRATTRYERTGRRQAANVVELFPSRFGGRRGTTRTPGGERATPEDREPRAISCYQCGFPIKDYAAVSACPACGSDNVTGKRL
jgi:rubrerythrin